MFGLPSDVDLTFLIGPRLEQVAIGENEIIFRFEEYLSLNVEAEFELGTLESMATFSSPRDAAQAAVACLGHSIMEESHSTSGVLTLLFDNGAALRLRDTSNQYESYEIHRADQVWIV